MSGNAGGNLRTELGDDLEVIDQLTDDECAELMAMIDAARRTQRAALDTSITEVLGHLPRLARLPARKIMFG
jgi:hypothetical protein